MTNIKYLKENDLYDAHKHFMRLAEGYISIPEELEEDGEDPNANGGQDPDAMGGMPQDPMGQDPSQGAMGGGAPMGDANSDPMQGDPNAMGADPSAMGQDPMMGADPNAMGGMPQDPMGGDVPPMDGGEPTDEGDTIDIAGLTRAEDKLNIKQNQIGRDLSKVDSRISSLITTIEKLQSALDANNSEIENLKSEFEKRNPTQTEKLNLRSLDSYPFNVKPSEYWADKAKDGGYQAYADNDEPTTKEYVITNDDVDNPTDDIADTFFKIDDDDIQTLDKLFRL